MINKRIFKAPIFIVFLFALLNLQAQESTLLQSPAQDSTSQRISQQEGQLQVLLQQQRDDSIKRMELEERLLALKIIDSREKIALVDELSILRNRDSIALQRRKEKVESLRKLNQGVAVVPFLDTLFTIYTNTGSFTAKERAETASRRIQQLADTYAFKADSLKIVEEESNTLLVWGDVILLGLHDQDALWMNTDRQHLAKQYQGIISKAITQHREETSLRRILLSTAEAFAVIAVVVFMIITINRLGRLLRKKLVFKKGQIFNGFHVKGVEVISAERQIKAIWMLISVLKWIILLNIVYLSLPILFNLFPSTRGYTDLLLGYFLAPVKKIIFAVINYLPNLITIAIIFAVFYYLLRMLRFFAGEIENGHMHINGFYKDWANPTYQIIRVLALAFMMVVIFPYLPGSDSAIFKGVSVFIGVLFTFGSAGALGNIVAGLVLTYMRSFNIGDRVKIGDVSGDIIERSLLVTRIRTIKNEIISIPNSQVMNSHTINFSSDASDNGLIVHTTVTMGYEIPWQKVHEVAIKAALQVTDIEQEPKPFVYQTSLDDYYVSYQINGYTRKPNRIDDIHSDLHRALLDGFHDAGIEVMSPHFHAVRDGSVANIPLDKLSPRYQAPAIKIKVKKDS